MSRFLSCKYNSLEPYVPGEQPQDKEYVKLNTNESPYPPSETVIGAIDATQISDLRLYPDPECKTLKDALSSLYGVKRENIYLANGSDDILNFAFSAFCDEKTPAYFPDITYGFYSVFAKFNSVRYTEIPLRDDFSVDPKDYFGLRGTIFIANPNAPTGLCLSLKEIESILQNNRDNIVVIDEAYVDFGAESALPLIDKYDNLLVVRTYSKSRSMAGARLGYAFASEGIISDLELLRYSTNPYNIDRLTLVAGIAAVADEKYYQKCCNDIERTREYTYNALSELGFEVLPSKANFLFAKRNGISGERLYLELKKRGVLVRHFNVDRIKDYVRITIGRNDQMDFMMEKIKEIPEEIK